MSDRGGIVQVLLIGLFLRGCGWLVLGLLAVTAIIMAVWSK